MDELFGTALDTRERTLGELENGCMFSAKKEEIAAIVEKNPCFSRDTCWSKKGQLLVPLYALHRPQEGVCPDRGTHEDVCTGFRPVRVTAGKTFSYSAPP